MAVYIRKVLDLALLDQVLVGFGEVHLAQSPIPIDVELLQDVFALENLLGCLLANLLAAQQAVHHHVLALPLRGLIAEHVVHFVDV